MGGRCKGCLWSGSCTSECNEEAACRGGRGLLLRREGFASGVGGEVSGPVGGGEALAARLLGRTINLWQGFPRAPTEMRLRYICEALSAISGGRSH